MKGSFDPRGVVTHRMRDTDLEEVIVQTGAKKVFNKPLIMSSFRHRVINGKPASKLKVHNTTTESTWSKKEKGANIFSKDQEAVTFLFCFLANCLVEICFLFSRAITTFRDC